MESTQPVERFGTEINKLTLLLVIMRAEVVGVTDLAVKIEASIPVLDYPRRFSLLG